MNAAKVAVDKGVSGLRLVRSAFRQAEVPLAVLLPRVVLQECVFVGGAGLDVAPVAIEDVLASGDGLPCPLHGAIVDGVGGHVSV